VIEVLSGAERRRQGKIPESKTLFDRAVIVLTR